jgi:hypothetical protein
MIVAFHFRADQEKSHGSYAWAIQNTFFRCLQESSVRDIHVEIFTGDLLVHKYMRDEASRENILRGLLSHDPRRWRTLQHDEFATTLFSAKIYVLAVEGMSPQLQDYLDNRLTRDASYLGAFEIDPANRVHWALYRLSLIPRYRYVDGEIRLFYREFEEREGAETKDTGRAADLERLGFRVGWEDIGVRHTIFDSYESFERAARLADLEGYLSEHLARMANEILVRTAALDPSLNDVLYEALEGFERIRTPEQIARVPFYCRRFLERLANALYPPRTEPVKGRSVGAEAYRNRLWAYVEDNLQGDEQKLVLAQLQDVGNRIDRADKVANKGLHDQISYPDSHRLIVAFLALAYDILSLATPPLQAPLEPYSVAIVDFARGLGELDRRSGKKDKEDDQ